MNNLIEPPVAIIVTLPKRFFEEQNHATYLEELQNCNDDHMWIRVCKNLPKHDVLYVYTIIDNKLHHRSMFAGLARNQDYDFPRPDGQVKSFRNVNAIITTGPVVFAPHEIKMKGFQGFRYATKKFTDEF